LHKKQKSKNGYKTNHKFVANFFANSCFQMSIKEHTYMHEDIAAYNSLFKLRQA